MKKVFKTQGTCSKAIELELENGKILGVKFAGGCDGNAQGISKLVVGMDAEDTMKRLRGIRCGFRSTSCPDQLAQAIEVCLAEEKRS